MLIATLGVFKIYYRGIDSRKATHILYLYLEKAFDKVDHACLLKKLVSFGGRDYLLKLIESYLRDRYQRVTIEDCSSSILEVTSGVPKGSPVGPLFFLVHINSLPVLFLTQAACFIRADDTKLLASDSNLLTVLPELENWASKNKMIFQAEKSKIINFYGDYPHYILNCASVEIVSSHKDLGLTMTYDLNWSLHISTPLQKAYNTFFFARRNVSGAISVKSKLDLYKSTILSTLCYASSCWFASRGDMKKIEQLQRRVTKWVLPWKSIIGND